MHKDQVQARTLIRNIPEKKNIKSPWTKSRSKKTRYYLHFILNSAKIVVVSRGNNMAEKKGATIAGFYGWPKPVFANVVKTNKHFDRYFHGALLYAHYELSASDLKKEVAKYLKSLDSKNPLLDKIKDMHENRLVVIGKYMYILNHGGDIPDKIMPTLMPALEKIINEEEAKAAAEIKEIELRAIQKEGADINGSPPTKVVVNIQDRLREKAKEVAGEVEGWIDEFIIDKKSAIKNVDDFVSLFKSNDLKGPHMKYVRQAFERRAQEVAIAVEGKDKDLAEAYSNFKKPELKKLHTFFENLSKATEMLQEAAKVVRAPKKKKPVSQEKLVSKIKYKKEDPTLGIVSLNPVQIIGAKEVWLYNCKTRRLAQYKSMDERGLLVKGTSLQNFSTDSAEKILRKPKETLAEFKKASKIKLRTFLKDLTTVDAPANGKLNDNHIILRIDK